MNEALRQLETLLSNAAAAPARFGANSRYNAVQVLQRMATDGRPIAYVARRFIAPPMPGVAPLSYSVVFGDRLDLIANRFIGDPEQWWKIADANPTLDPRPLTGEPGLVLNIPSLDVLGPGGRGPAIP
jgi:nucleoid-associated protein YgaU